VKSCTDRDGKIAQVSKDEELTVKRQCELLDVNRTSYYYEPSKPELAEIEREEKIKARLDYWHTMYPYMGSRKLVKKLKQDDRIESIGRKRVRRYMEEMGIVVVQPKPNLSKPGKDHKKFPYLLRNKITWLPNQVWAIDITYIAINRTHMYLTAIIDLYSRFIIGWALSDTLEAAPVLECLKEAFSKYGIPAIINSDQGSQFTCDEYIKLLELQKIRQSMDGKARWVDNVIIERWFRSLKVENIYINEYTSPRELRIGVSEYIESYNFDRPHANLNYLRPSQVYNEVFQQNDDVA
jgi:putative transposase